MPKMTFIESNGTRHDIEAAEDMTVMRAAQIFGIPGIDGDCGGMSACATCHIYVSLEFSQRLPPLSDQERDMLELAFETNEASRLGCQIMLNQETDGLVVQLPSHQH